MQKKHPAFLSVNSKSSSEKISLESKENFRGGLHVILGNCHEKTSQAGIGIALDAVLQEVFRGRDVRV